MNTTGDAIQILMEWSAFREKRHFTIGYGYGFCEALVVTLFDDGKEVGFAVVGKAGLRSAVMEAARQSCLGVPK